MVHRNTMWGMLEKWSPMVFFTAGGLFALLSVLSGLNAVAETGIALSPAVVFVCMLVVFVGLLGLYPRLADRDIRLAKVGIGLLGGTVAISIPAIGVFTPSTGLFVGETTALALVIAVAFGATLTVVTFGFAMHRTGAYLRPVGDLLLLMAASTSVMIGAMVVYGHSTPSWIPPVVNGSVGMSLGAIGFVLRAGAVTTVNSDLTGDITAS